MQFWLDTGMPARLACAALVCAGALGFAAGCQGGRCGPSTAVVTNVIDGDTVDLDSGERVRYLLIDTPEITGGSNDCFGDNARQFNSDLVLGREVALEYDVECEDRFGRLLAYVTVGGVDVNARLVERGYACTLFIPPSGADRRDEFANLEAVAKAEGRGMWGACPEVACD